MIHSNKEIMLRTINFAKNNFDNGKHAIAAIIVKGDEIISESCTSLKR